VTSAFHVRVLRLEDSTEALRACGDALTHHLRCPELHYLRAGLLLERDDLAQAELMARRALRFDRSFAAAHYALGLILRRTGRNDAARRSFQTACELVGGLCAEVLLPMSDGQLAGALLRLCTDQIAELDAL
jgi:Flp pilus assembly protein TadD